MEHTAPALGGATLVTEATRCRTFIALPPEDAQYVEEFTTTVTPLFVEQAAAWAAGAPTRVTPPTNPTVTARASSRRRRRFSGGVRVI